MFSCRETRPAAFAEESIEEMTHWISAGSTPYSCCRMPRSQVSEVDEKPGVATLFPRRSEGSSMPRSVRMKMLRWRNTRSGKTGSRE